MDVKVTKRRHARSVLRSGAGVLSLAVMAGGVLANAQFGDHRGDRDDRVFFPGNLVLSRSVYDNNAKNVQTGTVLPPGCSGTSGGCGLPSGAPDNGTYPYVWNDVLYDASFGITSRI